MVKLYGFRKEEEMKEDEKKKQEENKAFKESLELEPRSLTM